MSTTMRFPKWLLEELFTVYYDPKRETGAFQVFIRIDTKRPGLGSVPGVGHSVAEAAKHARKAREDYGR
jgi:hypothetical protein